MRASAAGCAPAHRVGVRLREAGAVLLHALAPGGELALPPLLSRLAALPRHCATRLMITHVIQFSSAVGASVNQEAVNGFGERIERMAYYPFNPSFR